MADGAIEDKTIRQRAFRELAKSRVRQLGFRCALYAVGALLSAWFMPVIWGAACLALIAAAEAAEFSAATAFLRAPRRMRDTSATGLIAANLATALAVAIGLATIWGFAGDRYRAVAICVTAMAVLAAAVVNRQSTTLMLTRQLLYTGAGVVMTVRELATAGQLWTSEAILQIGPILAFAGLAVVMWSHLWRADRARLARERMLAKARVAAEQADAAKSRFIATVSHELRTPLNSMLGLAQVVLGSKLSLVQRRQLEIIFESGRALNALLNDILDYSKLEAGKLEIEPRPADLGRIVREVVGLYELAAQDKGLALIVSLPPDLPASLVFDAVRVRQCLGNLLSNAIKFTETGSVRLTLTTQPARDEALGRQQFLVTATVADTGIGIPAGRRERLFQPFSQADSSISRRYGGTGLGLNITRQLAVSMGGDVACDSVPGEGSEFRLTFLAGAEPESAAHPTPAAAGLASRKVLVVDDVETNRTVLRLFLQPLGIDVVEAADGAAALAALGEGDFDAMFLDLSLPDIDGAEIAARIRRGDSGRWDMALIAVTADSAGSAIDLGAGGFDALIRKPVDRQDLLVKLTDAMRHRAWDRTGGG